eukprot:Selendium_serpulae@DN3890_c0_g1_i3.p2
MTRSEASFSSTPSERLVMEDGPSFSLSDYEITGSNTEDYFTNDIGDQYEKLSDSECRDESPDARGMYPDDMYPDDMYPDDMYPDDMYPDDMYPDDMYPDD